MSRTGPDEVTTTEAAGTARDSMRFARASTPFRDVEARQAPSSIRRCLATWIGAPCPNPAIYFARMECSAGHPQEPGAICASCAAVSRKSGLACRQCREQDRFTLLTLTSLRSLDKESTP